MPARFRDHIALVPIRCGLGQVHTPEISASSMRYRGTSRSRKLSNADRNTYHFALFVSLR